MAVRVPVPSNHPKIGRERGQGSGGSEDSRDASDGGRETGVWRAGISMPFVGIGLCSKGQPRNPEDWGTLRAWAWGASRALDYFETDPAVDAKQVGIEGLSRYGKAALVTMAYDQRFAIGLIGSSGEGGAKLHRRNFGELVENLTGSGEYHWMAGNFLKYGGPLTPGDLPVDAHELIALCAPRPTFISYGASTGPGAEGQWVDQRPGEPRGNPVPADRGLIERKSHGVLERQSMAETLPASGVLP